MSGGSVVFQLFSHVFDRFHHIRITWRAFYTFFNVNYCRTFRETILFTMGGRYHQKYYTCEMNGHKQKLFIVNTNDSLCLEMIEHNVVT
jgi:hypothetical protein